MKNLDDEIEKTMHALDGIAPAEPKRALFFLFRSQDFS